jgi:hypothetical protein
MAARKRGRGREIHESLVTRGLTDQSLAGLHERAAGSAHRADDDHGIHYGDAEREPDWAETDLRIRSLLTEDTPRTSRATWRRWRSYGRRHGTEHPEQTADRVQRHQAAEAARMTRIDSRTSGRAQDRFAPRTSGSVAQNGSQSRRLNARRVEQPPPAASRGFDFQDQSFDGGPYGRGSGHRPGHADYAWRMEDGFRY